jgi:hypothetical protein
MRRRQASESGQSIVLLALSLVGLIAFVALAIDGGRLYAEKRHAQNAADNAALAAARSKCLSQDFVSVAYSMANENGYDNDGVGDIVTVNSPPASGPDEGDSEHVEVIIVSNFPGTLIQFFRPGGLQVTVRAVGECVPGVGEGRPGIFAISRTCNNALYWNASGVVVHGGLHSNNDLQIRGKKNQLFGMAGYVTAADAAPQNITLDPPGPANPKHSRPIDDFTGLHLEDYDQGGDKAASADEDGRYVHYDGDIDVNWLKNNGYYVDETDTIVSGLYYATGDIDIKGRYINGTVTFVAEGEIHFTGPDQDLSAYVDGLLAFSALERETGIAKCNTPVIQFSLCCSVYNGLSYAPYGNINVSGSGIQINGALIGYSISLSGNEAVITYPSSYMPPDPGWIQVTE